MTKYIIAFLLFIIVVSIIVFPFKLVISGFIAVAHGSAWGFVSVAIGLILLRLIKPISIATGKDYKIF